MTTFTKQDIVSRVLEHNAFETKKAATEVLDLILSVIEQQVIAGNDVYLGQAFGGFKPSMQSARSGAMNGVAYATPSKKTIKFKPSAALKAAIAGS